ncbi:hypothetical protein ZHAS_00007599 [Anopheles sinensis]|uniref:Uncharacterized protein n=1 Tax=Anopheles sinensis TaxID=74873 RepID=A0A084VQH9_ANOSI|nr:hypothetical protein ZHAS_00007599 [Anopheles sinensis]
MAKKANNFPGLRPTVSDVTPSTIGDHWPNGFCRPNSQVNRIDFPCAVDCPFLPDLATLLRGLFSVFLSP